MTTKEAMAMWQQYWGRLSGKPTATVEPPFGHCDTCRAPLFDLICSKCGEVYD